MGFGLVGLPRSVPLSDLGGHSVIALQTDDRRRQRDTTDIRHTMTIAEPLHGNGRLEWSIYIAHVSVLIKQNKMNE